MAMDTVSHEIPLGSDAPARSAFDKLSRSIRDAIPVANTTARTAMLAALASVSPAVTPSASSPIFFHQADLPAHVRTIYTQDGSNFISLSGMYVWANASARAAATGMATDARGYQVDTRAEYRYTGSAWQAWESNWIVWTTSPSNFAVGTGGSAAVVQRYKWIAGRVYFEYEFTLGSSGASVGTNPEVNLPFAIKTFNGVSYPTGDGGAVFDASSGANAAYSRHLVVSATAVRVYFTTIASPTFTSITASAPMTWAAGDKLAGGFWADPQ